MEEADKNNTEEVTQKETQSTQLPSTKELRRLEKNKKQNETRARKREQVAASKLKCLSNRLRRKESQLARDSLDWEGYQESKLSQLSPPSPCISSQINDPPAMEIKVNPESMITFKEGSVKSKEESNSEISFEEFFADCKIPPQRHQLPERLPQKNYQLPATESTVNSSTSSPLTKPIDRPVTNVTKAVKYNGGQWTIKETELYGKGLSLYGDEEIQSIQDLIQTRSYQQIKAKIRDQKKNNKFKIRPLNNSSRLTRLSQKSESQTQQTNQTNQIFKKFAYTSKIIHAPPQEGNAAQQIQSKLLKELNCKANDRNESYLTNTSIQKVDIEKELIYRANESVMEAKLQELAQDSLKEESKLADHWKGKEQQQSEGKEQRQSDQRLSIPIQLKNDFYELLDNPAYQCFNPNKQLETPYKASCKRPKFCFDWLTLPLDCLL